jgi:tRNA pseudouridine13 synthase
MPNYFGEQRFGRRGDNHLLGAALVRGDDEGLLKILLGSPHHEDDSQAMGARKAFDRGDLQQAMRLYPRSSGMERRILHRLTKSGDAKGVVRAIDEKLRRLWISALQSELFNQVVAQRIESIDRLVDGDLAWKHENGACFAMESAEVEQPRATIFEISPTGPLLGYRMTLPAGKALEIEENVFNEYQLSPGAFRVEGRLRVKGARRPLRVQPKDVEVAGGVDEFGPHITFAFSLPPGSFATVFLRECMKND